MHIQSRQSIQEIVIKFNPATYKYAWVVFLEHMKNEDKGRVLNFPHMHLHESKAPSCDTEKGEKRQLVEISGGQCVVADVSTASAAIIKANDARGLAVSSAWQPALFLLDNLTNN